MRLNDEMTDGCLEVLEGDAGFHKLAAGFMSELGALIKNVDPKKVRKVIGQQARLGAQEGFSVGVPAAVQAAIPHILKTRALKQSLGELTEYAGALKGRADLLQKQKRRAMAGLIGATAAVPVAGGLGYAVGRGDRGW